MHGYNLWALMSDICLTFPHFEAPCRFCFISKVHFRLWLKSGMMKCSWKVLSDLNEYLKFIAQSLILRSLNNSFTNSLLFFGIEVLKIRIMIHYFLKLFPFLSILQKKRFWYYCLPDYKMPLQIIDNVRKKSLRVYKLC